jgi:hypothetical protein
MPRVRWDAQVEIEVGGQRVTCQCMDISQTGLRVRGSWSAYRGQPVTITLQLEDRVDVQGEVVWSSNSPEAGWGIRFTSVHPIARRRIARFVIAELKARPEDEVPYHPGAAQMQQPTQPRPTAARSAPASGAPPLAGAVPWASSPAATPTHAAGPPAHPAAPVHTAPSPSSPVGGGLPFVRPTVPTERAPSRPPPDSEESTPPWLADNTESAGEQPQPRPAPGFRRLAPPSPTLGRVPVSQSIPLDLPTPDNGAAADAQGEPEPEVLPCNPSVRTELQRLLDSGLASGSIVGGAKEAMSVRGDLFIRVDDGPVLVLAGEDPLTGRLRWLAAAVATWTGSDEPHLAHGPTTPLRIRI